MLRCRNRRGVSFISWPDGSAVLGEVICLGWSSLAPLAGAFFCLQGLTRGYRTARTSWHSAVALRNTLLIQKLSYDFDGIAGHAPFRGPMSVCEEHMRCATHSSSSKKEEPPRSGRDGSAITRLHGKRGNNADGNVGIVFVQLAEVIRSTERTRVAYTRRTEPPSRLAGISRAVISRPDLP